MMSSVAVWLIAPSISVAEHVEIRRLRNRIETGKPRFAKQVEMAHKSLLGDFDLTIAQLPRQQGIPKSAMQHQLMCLKREREAFAESLLLPSSDAMLWPTVRYVDTVCEISSSLRRDYERLSDRLAKAGDSSGSKTVMKEKDQILARLLPQKPLEARRAWTGSRHFLVTNTDFNLWIERKSDTTFRGTVKQNRGWEVMRVAGTLDGNKLAMETTEIVRGKPRRLQFTGYLLDDRMVLLTNGITKDGHPANDYVNLLRN